MIESILQKANHEVFFFFFKLPECKNNIKTLDFVHFLFLAVPPSSLTSSLLLVSHQSKTTLLPTMEN